MNSTKHIEEIDLTAHGKGREASDGFETNAGGWMQMDCEPLCDGAQGAGQKFIVIKHTDPAGADEICPILDNGTILWDDCFKREFE